MSATTMDSPMAKKGTIAMRHLTGRMLLAATAVLLVAQTTCAETVSTAKNHPSEGARRYDTYRGLVLTGYQGWFNAEGDGSGRGWFHYRRDKKFEPGHCTIDFWPDMREYSQKYATDFTFEDGSSASVFSSYDSSTVDLHYRWMSEYGIDGAFMQRFVHNLKDKKTENHYDVVFDSAIRAATKYKRAISIRYDLTGMERGYSQVLLKDLDKLNAKYDFFGRGAFPTFLHHNGKPLVAIGGVGFSDDIAGDDDVGYLKEAETIVRELRKRRYSIMMRVPAQWREFRGSLTLQAPKQQARFHKICQSVDVIMPWHVGAYRKRTYIGGNWQKRIADDIAWCHAHGLEYVPVIFPGFSRANLKRGEDGSFRPRAKGAFYWLQASSAVKAGAKMVFVAQFDEMDEGNADFQVLASRSRGR